MYKIVRISDNSYTLLQKLFRDTYGIKHSISSIEKKYNTNMFGLKNVGMIAEPENGINSPAAYYGVFPVILTYESKDYLVAQSGDTMTSPSHRQKGLFVKLAIETYKLANNLNIKMIFGFPNENSYPGFKNKLNWIFYGHMQRFTIINSTIPFCELASKFKLINFFYKKYTKIKLKKYIIEPTEDSIKSFSSLKSIGEIKKDKNYFIYKLNNEYISLINIDDFTLLIKPNPHLIIGAVGYFEKEKTNEFLDKVKKLSKKLGCKKIIFTISKNHWLFDYLIEKINPSESLPIGFYKYNDDFNFEKIQFTHADYDTF